MKPRSIEIGEINFVIDNLDNVAEFLTSQIRENLPISVVTPNVCHFTSYYSNWKYRDALLESKMVLPDGWPVALLCSIAARKIVKRVPGSTLMLEIIRLAHDRNLSIAILGGRSNSAIEAGRIIQDKYPGLKISICHIMEPTIFTDTVAIEELRNTLGSTKPDIIFVGVGSPKQEIFTSEHLLKQSKSIILNIGAGIDFISGHQKRAPLIFQRTGTEWLFRLLEEPSRLFLRYIFGFIHFLRFCLIDYLGHSLYRKVVGKHFYEINKNQRD